MRKFILSDFKIDEIILFFGRWNCGTKGIQGKH